MSDETRVKIESDTDVVLARGHGRAIGRKVGFSDTDLTIIVTAISEVARNILIFAKTGEIVLKTADQPG
ncbi:MAG: ATP-binding protein, partial [Bacteroidetes bacterium]|nr:ATP-binding protein [Bacteroidota bacterium]